MPPVKETKLKLKLKRSKKRDSVILQAEKNKAKELNGKENTSPALKF